MLARFHHRHRSLSSLCLSGLAVYQSTLHSFAPRQHFSSSSMSQANIPEQVGAFKRTFGPVNLDEAYSHLGQTRASAADGSHRTLSRWQSEKSGLRVVHVDTGGPLVSLYAAIATEIFTDAGLPHTLEHATFLGSEQYPYKGMLDTLSNRAFADGTNAWTDTTNTVYTIQTAGSEGFLRILPIYLDHILYPTMTDAGFTTEIYHVNGQGQDSGVVFSEMQGRENGAMDRMMLRTQRTLFKEGSGYRSETGGLMDALRVLSIQQIRDYHKSYYLPHNMCIIVAGHVDPTQLLQTLTDTVEPSIEKHGQALGPRPPGWSRPWVETPSANDNGAPALEKSTTDSIDFPEADESVGEWQRSWKGVPFEDFMGDTAIDLLCTYLSDTAVAPLNKALVEIEEPLATDIGFYSLDYKTGIYNLGASNVPTEELDSFGSKVDEVFHQVKRQGIDMDRMRMLIDRDERRLLDSLEKEAGDVICAGPVLLDFLYGSEDGKDMNESLKDLDRFGVLKGWSANQWVKLLDDCFISAPSFTLSGKPSKQLADTIEEQSKARVEENKKKFGPEGLKKLQEQVEAAQKENDKPIPQELLSSFKIPSVDSIDWFSVESARSTPGWGKGKIQQHIDSDPAALQHFVQFEHVASNFLTLGLFIFPSKLPAHLRPLASLYVSSFFSLPVKRSDGQVLSYEEVIRQLSEQTVEYATDIGYPLSEALLVTFRVEKSKYAEAVQWLHDLCHNSIFDIERLKITLSKAVQQLPSEKREGAVVSRSALRQLVCDESKSLSLANDLLSRDQHDPEILERLQSEPEKVVEQLNELRTHITNPSSMRIYVGGDISNLKEPKTTWSKHFETSSTPAPLAPIVRGIDVCSPLGQDPQRKALLYSMPSIESSFSYHAAKGPLGVDHPDRPALAVVLGVMNALESFLWKYIRGAGLAYGARISEIPESGLLTFNIYRSPDAFKAWKAAKDVVDQLVKGDMTIEPVMLESAKSTLAFGTASKEANVAQAAMGSFVNQALREVPQSFSRDLLSKASDVTNDDCLRILKQYIQPLFKSESSIAAIAAGKAKSEEIAKSLEQAGFDVEVRTLEGVEEDSGSEEESGSSGSEMDEN